MLHHFGRKGNLKIKNTKEITTNLCLYNTSQLYEVLSSHNVAHQAVGAEKSGLRR